MLRIIDFQIKANAVLHGCAGGDIKRRARPIGRGVEV